MPAAFWKDTQEALVATGVLKKDADAMIDTLKKSGRAFADVGAAIMAAYQRPQAVPAQANPVTPAQPKPQPQQNTPTVTTTTTTVQPANAVQAGSPPVQPTNAAQRQPAIAPAFDPTVEAKKQRDAEVRKEQIKAAYDQMYGAAQQTKSAFDVTLDVAQKMRGTIGGTFGTLAGALLDVVAAVQEAKGAAQKGVPASPQQPSLPTASMPSMNNQPAIPTAQAAPPIPTASVAPALPAGSPVPPVATVAPPTPVATAAAPSGEAAAAGGIGEMAAAAAGPLAVVAAVVIALQAVRDAAMAAVRGVGDFATAIASADASAASSTTALGEGTKQVSEKLFYLSPALGILGSVAGEATSSLGKFMKAVDATADRYAEYSPQIAQAQAMSEITHMLGDMRRAQQAGPELARYIQARSDLQQQFEETKIKLLTSLLPIATGMMKLVEVGVSISGIVPIVSSVTGPIADIARNIEDILRLGQAQVDPPMDPTQVLLGPQIQGGTGIQLPGSAF